MYNLRNYQSDAREKAYSMIANGKKRILIWMPTGSGKGLSMADFANEVASVGKATTTVMRRRELIFQTQKNYKKYRSINASVIMGNSKGYEYGNKNQVCSIDTIRTRMLMPDYQYLTASRLFIIDECHDTNSPTYQRMFQWIEKHNPDAIFLGFTATPFTVGGKPLDFWEDYIQPLTLSDARENGWLVPVLEYAVPAKIETGGLGISAGDFKESDLFSRASDSVIVGDIVQTWLKWGENRPTMMFCVNKEHSMLMTAAFNMKGIPCIHIDESTTSSEREAALDGLKKGRYKIISNIETMTTGVDCPIVSCIISARPTWSEVLHCQSIGRGLRPYKICADCGFEYGGDHACLKCGSTLLRYEKKDCIILDHAANIPRHGFTYDPRRAKLKKLMGLDELKAFKTGSNKRQENPLTMCEPCFVYVKPGQPCPRCNVVKKSIELPKTEGGELSLVDEETVMKIQFNQILSAYSAIKNRAAIYKWQDGAVWLQLHKQCGDIIFRYSDKLGMPSWVEQRVWKDKQKAIYEKLN